MALVGYLDRYSLSDMMTTLEHFNGVHSVLD